MVLLWLLLGLIAGGSACVGNSSFSCLRVKLGKAVWRINAIPEIPVTDWMSLVRQNRSWDSGRQGATEPEGLLDILASGVDTFLETRSLRFSLPDWMKADNNKVEVDIVKALVPEKSAFVGRRKGGGGKKGNGMGMMMVAMMGKMAMMTMGLIKMKAMKALVIGAIALVIAKLQLFKMLTSKGGDSSGESHVIVVSGGGSHGGGVGGHGAGGGGGHGGGAVHVVHETYGPPSGSWSGGGGDSWGGGGGGHGGWSSGGGGGAHGGGGGGGWTSGSGGGSGGGWSSGGGWGKRAYGSDNTYSVSTTSSQTVD